MVLKSTRTKVLEVSDQSGGASHAVSVRDLGDKTFGLYIPIHNIDLLDTLRRVWDLQDGNFSV